MALEIKWQGNPKWSGRIIRDGIRTRIDLGVPVEGIPPASRKLKERGDDAFERSRLKAELSFERKMKEFESGVVLDTSSKAGHSPRPGKQLVGVEFGQAVRTL